MREITERLMFGPGTDAPKLQEFGPVIFEMSALVRRDWLIREKAHGVCRDGGVGRTHPATSDTHQVTQANLHCVVSGARFAGGVGAGLRPSLCELFACSLSDSNLRTTSALLVTHLTSRSILVTQSWGSVDYCRNLPEPQTSAGKWLPPTPTHDVRDLGGGVRRWLPE